MGENPVIPAEYNIISKFVQLPIVNIVNNYFSINGAAQYLFWYALGAVIYGYIDSYVSQRKTHPVRFHLWGLITLAVSSILFLLKITEIGRFSTIIYQNMFVYENYRIVSTCFICFSIVYLSALLDTCSLLGEIGRNSTALMGLEFITHSYIPLCVLPMLNMGIPTINSTQGVITITMATLLLNCWIARKIGKFFPVLNGRWKPKSCRWSKILTGEIAELYEK